MYIKKVKITKDGITKEVEAKDVKDYVANGWQEIKEAFPFNSTNPYNNTYKK